VGNKTKSLIFDVLQVGSIIFILLTGPIVSTNFILFSFQFLAIVILFVAVWQMRRTKYYRVPDIGKQGELVKNGIYKYIRNPMYLSELLFCGVLIINSFSVYRLIVFFLFLANFISKIQYEEILLNTYFKEFVKYKKTSWKLIPFLY
jgi:protein-S-isoprenylcysteine O-methyltransferase Ste14